MSDRYGTTREIAGEPWTFARCGTAQHRCQFDVWTASNADGDYHGFGLEFWPGGQTAAVLSVQLQATYYCRRTPDGYRADGGHLDALLAAAAVQVAAAYWHERATAGVPA